MQTARMLLFQYQPEEVQYLLARCRDGVDVPAVIERLSRKYPEMEVISHHDFSIQTRLYWLTRTRVGSALGLTSVLALIVGLVITSQTLYAATAASLREFAVLRALGLPRWRISVLVLAQSFWIGLAGVITSIPAALVVARLAGLIGAEVLLPPWLVAGTIMVTMAIALVSGLLALRSLRLVEPANLLALSDFSWRSRGKPVIAPDLTRSFGRGEERTIAVHEASLELRPARCRC